MPTVRARGPALIPYRQVLEGRVYSAVTISRNVKKKGGTSHQARRAVYKKLRGMYS